MGGDRSVSERTAHSRTIRPSTTHSTLALYGKSVLNAVLFFAVFMVLLPWLANRALPAKLPVPWIVGRPAAGLLFVGGIAVWAWCLDAFSRRGRGTPLPLDAPSRLVTTGPFARVRNPIMAAELAVIWAEGLWFASLGTLLYAALLSVVGHLMVVRIEEPELRARFGEEYARYARSVPRWRPTWRRRASTEEAD